MGKTYLTNQINSSPTISERAGSDIEDVKGLLLKYDNNGNVVPASVAGEMVLGMGIITNAEHITSGEDVDVQVKDIGLVKAGGTIKKGFEVMTDAKGKAITAIDGKFVIGVALEAAADGQFFYIQITKYYKPAAQ